MVELRSDEASQSGPKQSITISVADPYLADTRHPAPAVRCDHHDAAAEAASPVTVPMVVITHSTATLAATTSGSCGRNERGGANGGDGSDGENCLADHEALLGFYWMRSHILPVCRTNDLSVQRRAEFVDLNRPFGDGHHKRERHLLAGADARGGDSSVRQELARAIKSPTSKSGAKLRECTHAEVHTAVLTDYSMRAGTTLIGG